MSNTKALIPHPFDTDSNSTFTHPYGGRDATSLHALILCLFALCVSIMQSHCLHTCPLGPSKVK